MRRNPGGKGGTRYDNDNNVFVEGARDVCHAKKSSGDCHAMTGEYNEKWFADRLLLLLPAGSAVVGMDNAPCHSVKQVTSKVS